MARPFSVTGEIVVCVRVKFQAHDSYSVEAAEKDIVQEVKRVASRAVLERRHGFRVLSANASTGFRQLMDAHTERVDSARLPS